jgi:hypothetical protein
MRPGEWSSNHAFADQRAMGRDLGLRLERFGFRDVEFDLAHRIQVGEFLVAVPCGIGCHERSLGLRELGLLQHAVELHEHLPLLERRALGQRQAIDLGADFRRQRRVAARRQLGAHLACLQCGAGRGLRRRRGHPRSQG